LLERAHVRKKFLWPTGFGRIHILARQRKPETEPHPFAAVVGLDVGRSKRGLDRFGMGSAGG
jgi:hypothetical protein